MDHLLHAALLHHIRLMNVFVLFFIRDASVDFFGL